MLSERSLQKQFAHAITLLTLGFLFTACSSPYHAVSDEGFRYRASKINTQHFIVTVSSNTHENNAVEQHGLVKAAQLCAYHGYDWFEVITLETKKLDKGTRAHMEIWLDKGVRPDSPRAWSAPDLVDSTTE